MLLTDVSWAAGEEGATLGRAQAGGLRANGGAGRGVLRHQAAHTCPKERYTNAHCTLGSRQHQN